MPRPNTRKLRFQEVAERRAAHFARADITSIPSSVRSSTPTGSMRSRQLGNDESEAWPGPFATAHRIMERRDELKKLREEKLLLMKENGEGYRIIEEDNLDKYELALHKLTSWTPSVVDLQEADFRYSSVASLTNRCIDVLVQYIDNVVSLDCLSNEVRDRIAVTLSKRRKLNNETVVKICSEQSRSLKYTNYY